MSPAPSVIAVRRNSISAISAGRLGNAEPLRPNRITEYDYTGEEKLDTLYLHGHWHSGPEAVTLAAEQGDIFVRYRGKEVAFVFTPPGERRRTRGSIAGRRPVARICGWEMTYSYDGTAMALTVDTPRLYRIVNNPHHGTHTLRFHVCSRGISVYAIAFISECVDEVRGEEEAA